MYCSPLEPQYATVTSRKVDFIPHSSGPGQLQWRSLTYRYLRTQTDRARTDAKSLESSWLPLPDRDLGSSSEIPKCFRCADLPRLCLALVGCRRGHAVRRRPAPHKTNRPVRTPPPPEVERDRNAGRSRSLKWRSPAEGFSLIDQLSWFSLCLWKKLPWDYA